MNYDNRRSNAPDPGTVGDEQQPMVCDRCDRDCEPSDRLPSGKYRCLYCDDRRNGDVEPPEREWEPACDERDALIDIYVNLK